jgi:hypothetical protein
VLDAAASARANGAVYRFAKGDHDVPLLVVPVMLAACGVHALLQAATGDDRDDQIREAIEPFAGTREVLATMCPDAPGEPVAVAA